MPFTASHAIVALPFLRTPLLPAAIAVGAMAPDLPLFVRFLPLSYQTTHTNLLVSMVIALVLLTIWYLALRPAARELSPAWLARRLPVEWDASGRAAWRSLHAERPGARNPVWRAPAVFPVLVALSLAIGVLSHVAWDAFTHEGRWGVGLVPALDQQWGPLLGYKWVQYGSTTLGLVGLALFAALWLRRRSPASLERVLPRAIRIAWWVSLPIFLAAAWAVGLLTFGPFDDEFTPAHLGYRVLPPTCAAWGLVTLTLCLVVIVRRRHRGGGTPRVRQA